jgi:hypothetical protein
MKRLPVFCASILLLLSGPARRLGAQELLESPSPAAIQEALRLGSDDKEAAKLLQSYALQTRTGFGTGPLLGYCTTPFARVMLAAQTAWRAGTILAASDIGPELLSPELHVLLLPQQQAYAPELARIESVVLVAGVGAQEVVVKPTGVGSTTAPDLRSYLRPISGVTIARFPLTAMVPGSALRVSFSHVVRGSSSAANCKDCLVPLAMKSLR